ASIFARPVPAIERSASSVLYIVVHFAKRLSSPACRAPRATRSAGGRCRIPNGSGDGARQVGETEALTGRGQASGVIGRDRCAGSLKLHCIGAQQNGWAPRRRRINGMEIAEYLATVRRPARGGFGMLEGAEVRLAVDIAGTFTDTVLDVGQDRRTRKVLTTPTRPEQAALDGMRLILADARAHMSDIDVVIHGTTVA